MNAIAPFFVLDPLPVSRQPIALSSLLSSLAFMSSLSICPRGESIPDLAYLHTYAYADRTGS